MEKQGSLFDVSAPEEPPVALARASDPPTSHAAAASVQRALPRLQEIVLSTLRKSADGLTTHEIAAMTDIDVITVSPRIAPLREAGFVRDSGERRVPSGRTRPSTVWVAA